MLSSDWGRTWDPFAEMRRLQSEVNHLLGSAGTLRAPRAFPPVNLWQGENSVVVTAELPGIASEDVDVSVSEDALTIRGERLPASNDNQVAWHRRERPTGSFSRTIALPFRVDADRIQARFVNGVLEVEMRRPEADAPRKIEVKAS